jgi:subtilisin-like proprotein convertase family protein
MFVQRGLGAVAVASILAVSAQAQTIGCQVGSANGGAIPTSGTGGGGTPPPNPMIATLNVASVPPGSSCVTEVKLFGVTHTWAGDVQFVLQDPTGVQHNIAYAMGGSCDFGGDYSFVAQCVGAQPYSTCAGVVTPGQYEQYFNGYANGNGGIFNTPMSQIPAMTGTWTLYGYDWAGGDIGAVTSWDLCFGTPPTPSAPTAAPALVSPIGGALATNPITLTWNAANCAVTYDVNFDGVTTTGLTGTSFVVPNAAPGSHTWAVRGVNVTGIGPWSVTEAFNVPTPPPPSTCVSAGAASLGSIPTSGTGGGGVFPGTLPPSPYISTANIVVPPGATQIVKIDIEATHTYNGDLQFVLTDPSGTSHNIVCRQGVFCNLNGLYSVYTASGLNWPTTCATDVTPGDYVQAFGAWPTGTNNIFNTPLNTIPVVSGNWTLTIYDWAGADVGTVTEWKLCFDTGPAGPVAYCTAGTTTNGCAASITANANPSVSLAAPCNITVSNVEGQKSGLIFYSITGQLIQGWNASSFLCVKAPTQRSSTQVSGGTVGQCDGTLSLDWNAFQLANPTALGNPWSVGNKAQVQAWFRDPPAGKSTNLSNAIEMTYLP